MSHLARALGALALLSAAAVTFSSPASAGDEDPKPAPEAKEAEVPSQDLRAQKDEHRRYLLHGPLPGAKEPRWGWRLAVVLPGGSGSADFAGFVKNILRHGLGEEYVVAQPVALKWTEGQEVVWPTKLSPVPKMEFTTEEFVGSVVEEVKKGHRVDPASVFTLSWSSSGPAAYAIALQEKTPVTGSYVSMSVFFPSKLPPLKAARGRAFYIEHSPDDKVCLFKYAGEARDALKKHGAAVEFSTYPGGHGWTGGPIYPRIRKGFAWLEKQGGGKGK